MPGDEVFMVTEDTEDATNEIVIKSIELDTNEAVQEFSNGDEEFESIMAELLADIDQDYRKKFEAILDSAMERDKAFQVVLAHVSDAIAKESSNVKFSELSQYKSNFSRLSNLSVFSDLIDACGLSSYKETIMNLRIHTSFEQPK